MQDSTIYWTCVKCGASLRKVTPVKMPGHHHTTKRSWMGFVQFRRLRYVCPQCGANNDRDKRVRWS